MSAYYREIGLKLSDKRFYLKVDTWLERGVALFLAISANSYQSSF